MSTTTYRAAVVRSPEGPESIEMIDRPITGPGPGQIRVRIAAAAVNPVDLGVASGFLYRHRESGSFPGWFLRRPRPGSRSPFGTADALTAWMFRTVRA
ncbi:hypothetical protein [Nocardia testacea]|uniref:hypothetical protein n=1 Tax=Nocardia testacea TaxID=248551 RepID=UPI003A862EE2